MHTSHLAEHVSPYSPAAQDSWLAIARRGVDPVATLMDRVGRESMVLSFEDGFRIAALMIGLGIIMVMLIKRPLPQAAPSGAH